MCGSTRSTTSPSSSSTRRSTPWAAGCCGPKLMLNCRMSVSCIALSSERSAGGDAGEFRLLVDARDEAVPRHDHALVASLADELDAVVRLHLEFDAAPGDLGAFGIDRHRLPGHRGGGVRHIDVHAEAALTLLEVRRQ